MSPEQVSMITNLISLVKMLSGWPFALMFFMLVIGPWILSMMLYWNSRKRFESVVQMYEHNVQLVKDYSELAKDVKDSSKRMTDVVMINTQTFSTLTEAIKTNQFCPIVREKGGT